MPATESEPWIVQLPPSTSLHLSASHWEGAPKSTNTSQPPTYANPLPSFPPKNQKREAAFLGQFPLRLCFPSRPLRQNNESVASLLPSTICQSIFRPLHAPSSVFRASAASLASLPATQFHRRKYFTDNDFPLIRTRSLPKKPKREAA